MTFEDSYNIFKIGLDGEEFDSDEDALVLGNLSYREILADRDWKFLKKFYTLPNGTYLLNGITDLDKVLDVWLNGNKLKKATFEQRFDTSYDYWIDHANNALVPITTLTGDLIVDYKYKPAELEMVSIPVKDDYMCPLIGYKMKLNYMDKDQDLDTYNHIQSDYNQVFNLLIAHNESL